MALYDDSSVVVYQAFSEQIAQYAVTNQTFIGCPGYSTTRMTWVKTNFLWMMYRCGWCTKDAHQARVLALRLSREGFEEILRRSCPTTSSALDRVAHAQELAASEVRLQWDPDHNPDGTKCMRRAIQLGVKGQTASEFVSKWILAIEDITDTLVLPQAEHALIAEKWANLLVPSERRYELRDGALASQIGLSHNSEGDDADADS